jgi:hypothetical protein
VVVIVRSDGGGEVDKSAADFAFVLSVVGAAAAAGVVGIRQAHVRRHSSTSISGNNLLGEAIAKFTIEPTGKGQASQSNTKPHTNPHTPTHTHARTRAHTRTHAQPPSHMARSPSRTLGWRAGRAVELRRERMQAESDVQGEQ